MADASDGSAAAGPRREHTPVMVATVVDLLLAGRRGPCRVIDGTISTPWLPATISDMPTNLELASMSATVTSASPAAWG